ncbi:MAG: Oxidoreductase, short-chain dehydrogenase/reductase family [Ktedonobacterales bacterium]|nr:MAG: Oxidoreductase, short-chain dehydrogenase/reductase family [Ktedonobacterales bacterium]
MATNLNGSYAGKVAFITGAGSGIGRATALAFARAGASVVVADVSEPGSQETARMIEAAGGRALAVTCDVRQDAEVRAALGRTIETFGRLAHTVRCAVMARVAIDAYTAPGITYEGGIPMATWSNDELTRIGAAEELEIALERRNGTLRTSVTIWVVRHGDNLYVRSVNGRGGGWFRAAQARHEGHIQASGVEKDVTLVEVDASDDVNNAIDAAYRAKYRRYATGIVNTTLTPQARAATLKLVPRGTNP